jgi:hypothetical protein
MCGVSVARLWRRSGLLVLVATVGAGCSTTDAAPPNTLVDAKRMSCEAVPVVALLLDKSRSAPVSLVSQLAVQDLNPLIELLRACGGELGVGAIRDRAATPMVRLFIESPPSPPVPETVPEIGNPMVLAEQRARVDRAYKQQLVAYEPVSRRWATVTDTAIEEFRDEVRAVIEEPTTSPSTNIWAALRQADLFLSEPREGREENGSMRASTAIPVRHVLVALTDGIHTAAGQAYQLRSKPELFIVNSAGEAGVFAGMNPRRFESVPATFRALGAARSPRFGDRD